MMKKINEHQDIYASVLNELENLLFSLEKSSDNNEIEVSRQDAIEKLKGIREEVVDNINSLQRNSEWDTFTIAFYGETNAGKSTLIESLRILLNEEKKVKEHEEFNLLKVVLADIENKICTQNKELTKLIEKWTGLKKLELENIDDLKKKINNSQMEYEEKILSTNGKIQQHVDELEVIEENIMNLKIKKYYLDQEILNRILSNMWSLVKSIFNKLDEQNEIKKINILIGNQVNEMIQYNGDKEELIEKNDNENKKLAEKIDVFKVKQKQVEERINFLDEEYEKKSNELSKSIQENESKKNETIVELEKASDGAIIGDGRSDFTIEVEEYSFQVGNKKFVMLDLPGIEGNEESLQEIINQAVEKSHVVFYLSKKPTPPQKGDDKNLGTIEKISRQLSKHSEVHFIYNKPVRNPKQLEGDLVNDDDKKSLTIVDKELSNVLGESYKSHHYLSAYPAFLSLGEYANKNFEKGINKFLTKFDTKNNILEKSLILDFSNWMTIQLVNDIEKKIIQSNFKKIRVTLDSTRENLKNIYHVFDNLEIELQKNYEFTTNRLDNTGESYNQNINDATHKSITEIKRNIRQKIYSDIDNEIKNNEFNIALKKRIEEGILEFTDIMNSLIKESSKEFEKDVENIVTIYQRHVEELVNKHTNSVNFDFDFNPEIKLKMNIDFGTTVVGLIGSIVGIVTALANATNPIGWVILGLSVLTMLVGVVKKIRALVDVDFHKAQQKKSANENIDRAFDEINNKLDEQLSSVQGEINDGIQGIKEELKKPLQQIKTMSETFFLAREKVELISSDLVKEGEYYD